MWPNFEFAFGRSGLRPTSPGHRPRNQKRRAVKTRLEVELLEDRCLLSHFSLGALVQVSPSDLFAGASTGNQTGVNFAGTQVEPRVAVDPTNPNHLVGAWQQDRWDNSGSLGIVAGVSFDAGQTWKAVVIPGLTTASGGSFDRASDPWVSFGPTGVLYVSSLLLGVDSKQSNFSVTVYTKSGIAVSKSTDGGLSWSQPTVLIVTTATDKTGRLNVFLNDKESITADPHNPNLVYAIWDQHDTTGAGSTSTLFARSTDGGQTWSAIQVILTSPGTDSSIGHQIVVLPDGTLIDAFTERSGFPFSLEILRSSDAGVTWSAPIVAAQEFLRGVFDPFAAILGGVRNSLFPEVAVDSNTGNLYAVWEDARFSTPPIIGPVNGESIAFAMSSDGGLTWSSPIQINQTPANFSAPAASQAFIPSIAVSPDGTVAVTYYDFRYLGSMPGLTTDYWAVFGNPQGPGGLTNPANWGNELRLTAASFNLLNAPIAAAFMVGDYMGLAADGNNFEACFAEAGSSFPQAGIFSRQIVMGPAGPPAPAPAVTPTPTVVALQPTQPPPPTGFLAPAGYPVDQRPGAVAVGDFNGDGSPDLVTANQSSNDVSVLVGNGNGTFQPAQNLAVSDLPVSVAVGDFNGDGKLDIVTANGPFIGSVGTVSVLLGNGDGTFKKAQTFTLPNVIANQAPQSALSVAVGDFNRDGKLDLAVTAQASFHLGGRKGFIDVLLGQGDGTFKIASVIPINSSVPAGIALADFNGDGNLDVVTGNRGNYVSILLGQGDGTLRESNDPNVELFPLFSSVAVGDFNHDGIPDLVTAGGGNINGTFETGVSVLLGNGNGTFQAPQILVLGGEPQAVGVGDFNHDGNLDIVTADYNYPNPNTVSVLLGNGKGTFQALLRFPLAFFPTSLAVGDFNRDGFPDLAVPDGSSNSVAVFINSATWPALASTATASASLTSQPATLILFPPTAPASPATSGPPEHPPTVSGNGVNPASANAAPDGTLSHPNTLAAALPSAVAHLRAAALAQQISDSLFGAAAGDNLWAWDS